MNSYFVVRVPLMAPCTPRMTLTARAPEVTPRNSAFQPDMAGGRDQSLSSSPGTQYGIFLSTFDYIVPEALTRNSLVVQFFAKCVRYVAAPPRCVGSPSAVPHEYGCLQMVGS